MQNLKYKSIKSKTEYNTYCSILEELVYESPESKRAQNEIELLNILIERWDEEYNSLNKADSIELLQSLWNWNLQ